MQPMPYGLFRSRGNLHRGRRGVDVETREIDMNDKQSSHRVRRGTTIVEAALVLPLLLTLTFAGSSTAG